ncbi:hypothetical protein [Morganella sp. HMSC11D09]|uniref:hypothetical protein n=1 Tax=Morganella sp. HMSC11D09 TaxID=1581087 RepID=UPI001FF0795F|nr:hypothetical protein [Morganella sp. HMSC11D09]
MANLKITVVCLVALSPLLFLSDALAKNCKKGIPCGNSCISANKVCRIGTANSYSTKNYSNKSISTNSKKSLHGSTVAATGGVSADHWLAGLLAVAVQSVLVLLIIVFILRL